jgi:hypothetical protein
MLAAFAGAAAAQPGDGAAAPKAQQPGAPKAPDTVSMPAPIDPELQKAVPDQHGVKRMAILRGLNKVTGRAIEIKVPAGVPVRFGHLSITVRYCYTVPPEQPPETSAFLQIDDLTSGKAQRVFSGWMFASTPALNGLENPVYDVWVVTCKTDQPEVPPQGAESTEQAAPPTDGANPPPDRAEPPGPPSR